jgi:hypothetical protein
MNRCKQCGAVLPENGRICSHCGTDNAVEQAAPVQAAPLSELDFLKPALLGGGVMGVLTGVPLVGCLCCIWVVGGGALAAWQLDQQRPGTLKYGDGAMVGGLAGVIGGVVATLIGLPLQRLLMTPDRVLAWIERFVPNMPPEARESILQSFGALDLPRILLQTVMNIILLGIFALVGGCLAVAILNRNKTD